MNKKDLKYYLYLILTFLFLIMGALFAGVFSILLPKYVGYLTRGDILMMSLMATLFCLGISMWLSTEIPERKKV